LCQHLKDQQKFFRNVTPHVDYTADFWIVVLNVNTANALCDVTKQVLTYAQQSREKANYEQAALADWM